MGLLPHLFSMWPHPQQSSHLLSERTFVNASTWYRTPAALISFFIQLCAICLHFTTKATDDAAISLFCLLSQMVQGFVHHQTWVGITMALFSASNFSPIFCRPSVPFPMYRTRGTAWIFSLSQDTFSATSTTTLSTVLAAVMMMSPYLGAISAVAFWCVIAVVTLLGFLLAFMILIWAGVAGKSVSHHYRHSAWQRTERQRVYRDTGMMETDWATAGVRRYSGNGDGRSYGEYIFGRPWGR